MQPRQAWGAFTVILVLAVALAAVVSIDLGTPLLPTLLLAAVAIVIYLYVIYKRYNVEVIPENDLELLEDIEDLHLLSTIYGLDSTGGEADLRARLTAFIRENKDKAFVWVAPGGVARIGAALEVQSENRPQPGQSHQTRTLAERLVSDKPEKRARRAAALPPIKRCPVCETVPRGREDVCRECGADLGLYAVLMESKVGKKLASQKKVAAKRRLRYQVSSLGGKV